MAKKNISKKAVKSKSPKSNVPDLVIQPGFWKKNSLPAILLFAISALLYIQTYNYDFVLDDKIVYSQNHQVKKGFAGIGEILTTESMVGYFGEQQNLLQGSRYRPLSIVTFAMEQEFYGTDSYKYDEISDKAFANLPDLSPYLDKIRKDPTFYKLKFPDAESYLAGLKNIIPAEKVDQNQEQILILGTYSNSGASHLINMLLYGLLVLLLFRVLGMLFPQVNPNWYLGLAFVATLIFAIHPTHVEVVANVKGRDEIMALMGALGAMYFTLKYISTEKIIHLLASGLVFLLGLLSKENTMTFMAVIPLTIWFFTKSDWKKTLIGMSPLVISFLVFLFMRQQAVDADHIFDFGAGQASNDLMNNPFVDMNGAQKYATIFYTLGYYLKLLFVPYPLTHDYYPYQIPVMTWGNISTLLSFFAYIGLGAFAVWKMKEKNIISYGILFYLLTLSIVSNIFITTGTFMNERFLFFSTVGFGIVMGYLISRKLPAPVINTGLLAVMMLGFSFITFNRVKVWKDGYSLNVAGIQNSPNSARANLYMGTSIFEEVYRRETDPNRKKELVNEAEAYVDRALDIHPFYGSGLTMKVIVATEQYRLKSEIQPLLKSFTTVLKARGREQGRGVDNNIDVYLDFFKNRNQWIPELTQWSYEIGYEFFAQQQGDYPVAKKYLDFGLSLDPSNEQLKEARESIRQFVN